MSDQQTWIDLVGHIGSDVVKGAIATEVGTGLSIISRRIGGSWYNFSSPCFLTWHHEDKAIYLYFKPTFHTWHISVSIFSNLQ